MPIALSYIPIPYSFRHAGGGGGKRERERIAGIGVARLDVILVELALGGGGHRRGGDGGALVLHDTSGTARVGERVAWYGNELPVVARRV